MKAVGNGGGCGHSHIPTCSNDMKRIQDDERGIDIQTDGNKQC